MSSERTRSLRAGLDELERENALLRRRIAALEDLQARQEGLFNSQRTLLTRINTDYEQSMRIIEGQNAESRALAAQLGSALEQAARVNELLTQEVEHRRHTEKELERHRRELERLVQERTQDLEDANAKLRSLSRRVMTVQETERRCIGLELHDRALQTLAAVSLFLKNEYMTLLGRVEGHDFTRFNTALAGIGEVMTDLRRIISELRPAMLDDIGLEAAMRGLLEGALRQGPDLSARLNACLDESGVTDLQKLICYRVLQEAVSNVLRHSRARNVSVDVVQSEQGIVMTIADDGVGFDPATRREACIGIESMRERVGSLGGRFELFSLPGRGVTLTAVIPPGQ